MKPANVITKRRLRTTGPTVIDLFAGAGLLSLAFQQEGYKLIRAYELDANAAATYRQNIGDIVDACDLSDVAPSGSCDVVVAGPPCQGFSSLGKRKHDDPRNRLCQIIPLWAQQCGAKIAIVENVPAFLRSRAWKRMTDKFATLGYEVASWTLDASRFGVAQRRLRSFTVCSRVGLPSADDLREHTPTTVRDAFRNLPRFPCKRIQHFTRTPSAFAIKRMSRIPPGGDIRDLAQTAPNLVPPSWFRISSKVVDIWGRLDWDGVANTLRTGFLNPSRGRFLHPERNRPISFREAARLQGIPDSFTFVGKPEQISRQIGNGVPVSLGRAVAAWIRPLL